MEVKTEGMTAIVTIFANVAQFMESLAGLLGSGEFIKMSPDEQAEIVKNIHSIGRFLNETGIAIHNMIEGGQSIDVQGP